MAVSVDMIGGRRPPSWRSDERIWNQGAKGETWENRWVHGPIWIDVRLATKALRAWAYVGGRVASHTAQAHAGARRRSMAIVVVGDSKGIYCAYRVYLPGVSCWAPSADQQIYAWDSCGSGICVAHLGVDDQH